MTEKYMPTGVIDYRCEKCGKQTINLETVREGYRVVSYCKDCLKKRKKYD